ncbi:MAG: nickel-responsive transcriptional regulator NikR [Candidatus Eisenbacteria bacterium]|nr:nickel-responsive transcriptional regulator NikR [Candidatus Eisenbacteria bacterium]
MTKEHDTVRFTVSLPEDLLAELDRRMVGQGYASRSEFVRDLIRERMVAEKWADRRREVVGVLTIAYDHHQRDLAEKLIEIQHRKYVNILCATHVHLDHDNCLEVIIIRGRPPEIEKLSIEIGGLRGVRFSKLTGASSVEK